LSEKVEGDTTVFRYYLLQFSCGKWRYIFSTLL